MMISIQDLFNVQGQLKKTDLSSPASGDTTSPALLGNNAKTDTPFQKMVDHAAGVHGPKAQAQPTGQQETQLQDSCEAAFKDSPGVSLLQEMGFSEQEIEDLLEQFNAQALAGLFVTAVVDRQSGADTVFSGGALSGHRGGSGQGGSSAGLEQLVQQLSRPVGFWDGVTNGPVEMPASSQQPQGQARTRWGIQPTIEDIQKALSAGRAENSPGNRELQAVLKGLMQQAAHNSDSAHLTDSGSSPFESAEFPNGKDELLALLSRELQVGLKGSVRRAVQHSEPGRASSLTGSNPSPLETVAPPNGKEELLTLLSRLRNRAEGQVPENQGKPSQMAGGAATREGLGHGLENMKHVGPTGGQWPGAVSDSKGLTSGTAPSSELQFLQQVQTNEAGPDRAQLLNRPGLEAVRPAGKGTGNNFGHIIDGAATPGYAQTQQGVQDAGQALFQAKQAAAPSPQQPSSESNVVNQVFVRLAAGLQQGSRNMIINMHPPELGRVKVNLVSDNGRLSAVLHTENQQVQGILDRNLPQLRQSLQEQGLSIEDLGVSLDSGGQEGGSAFEEEQAGTFPGQPLGSADQQMEDPGAVQQEISSDHLSQEQGLNIRV